MFNDTSEIPDGLKIIVIDSLDEHPKREDWWAVTEKLSDAGWKVIWSCRDPDWDIYELSEKIPHKFKYDLQEKENYPWERNVPSWDLDNNETRFKEITEQIEDLGFNEDAGILQYVDYCYSTTQLMHIFYTNFSVIEDARIAVDKLLMKTLLNRRTKFIEDNKKYVQRTEIFEENNWYPSSWKQTCQRLLLILHLIFARY